MKGIAPTVLADFRYYRDNPRALAGHYRVSKWFFYLTLILFVLMGLWQGMIYEFHPALSLLRNVGSNAFGLCSALAINIVCAVNWVRLELYCVVLLQQNEALERQEQNTPGV